MPQLEVLPRSGRDRFCPGISITDAKGTLTYANSGLAEMLGYHPSELEGTNLSDLAWEGSLVVPEKGD